MPDHDWNDHYADGHLPRDSGVADRDTELPPRLVKRAMETTDVNALELDKLSTMLHSAIEHENHELIRTLVAHGADLELPALGGWYPLHHAADIDVDGVLQTTHSLAGVTFSTTALLLELGADPTVRRDDGATVRDQVARYCAEGDEEAAAMLDRLDQLLARYGADFDQM